MPYHLDEHYFSLANRFKNQRLPFERYTTISPTWDHDHCEICFATLCENATGERQFFAGFHIVESDRWICPRCYREYHARVGWTTDDPRPIDEIIAASQQTTRSS